MVEKELAINNENDFCHSGELKSLRISVPGNINKNQTLSNTTNLLAFKQKFLLG